MEDFKARIAREDKAFTRDLRDATVHIVAVSDFVSHAADYMPNSEAALALWRAFGEYKYQAGLVEKYVAKGAVQ
jgi:hypothetical protein